MHVVERLAGNRLGTQRQMVQGDETYDMHTIICKEGPTAHTDGAHVKLLFAKRRKNLV